MLSGLPEKKTGGVSSLVGGEEAADVAADAGPEEGSCRGDGSGSSMMLSSSSSSMSDASASSRSMSSSGSRPTPLNSSIFYSCITKVQNLQDANEVKGLHPGGDPYADAPGRDAVRVAPLGGPAGDVFRGRPTASGGGPEVQEIERHVSVVYTKSGDTEESEEGRRRNFWRNLRGTSATPARAHHTSRHRGPGTVARPYFAHFAFVYMS